ncbi:MAG: DUF1189 family protein [bacterium]
MKRFLRTIRSSIYDPIFYKDLFKKPLSYSFKYNLILTSVLALMATVFFSIFFIPSLSGFLNTVQTKIEESYPAGLEITFKGGIASTEGVEEPYYIPIQEGMKNIKNIQDTAAPVKNLLAIQTKEDFNTDSFTAHHSLFVLNQKTLAYYNDNGIISKISLKVLPAITINYSLIKSWSNKISPYFVVIPFIAILLFFLVAIIFLQTMLALLLPWALILMIIAKIKKIHISYGKAYQLGIHLITLPLIISGFFALLSINIPIPFLSTILYTIIFTCIAALNMKKSLYATNQNPSS